MNEENEVIPETEAPEQDAEPSMDEMLSAVWDEAAAEEDSPEDKPSEEEQPGETPESDDVAAAADGEDQPGAEPLSAPEHWSAEDKTLFEGQSDEVKQYLVDRDKTTASEYTRKTEELATQRKEREPLDALADQMAPYFATQGMTAAQGFTYLANAQSGLASGTPEQKVAALRQIAVQYGIPLTPDAQNESEYQDPEFGKLTQRQDVLEQYIIQSQQTAATQQQQATHQLVADFANEKNDAGELKHPHFEAVRGIMSPLMATAGNMEAAYEQAVMANPDTRKAVFDTLAAQAKVTEDKDRQERVNTAKKAVPSNTQSKSTASKPVKKLETVKDFAEEAFDELATA